MGQYWILFTFVYALLKGLREGMKKAALKKSGSNEILFFYTLIGWLFTLPGWKEAIRLDAGSICFVFMKSTVVCTAWMFAFRALKKMSVSLYGIMDLSRMIFSTLLGVFVLGESLTGPKVLGMVLVLTGLLLTNLKRDSESQKMSCSVLFAALMNCFFNAVSGVMDKILMQSMTSAQLQFWFMLFMTLIYGGMLFVQKESVSFRKSVRNIWIPMMSLSLIIGDKLLFEANASPNSQVTIMTVIKQCSVLVTVLTGWLVFHEKQIVYKMMCALIVISGILVAVLFG